MSKPTEKQYKKIEQAIDVGFKAAKQYGKLTENPECKICGLLKSTIDAIGKKCLKGYGHDFGEARTGVVMGDGMMDRQFNPKDKIIQDLEKLIEDAKSTELGTYDYDQIAMELIRYLAKLKHPSKSIK